MPFVEIVFKIDFDMLYGTTKLTKCLLTELLTGYPLLPGEDEGDQLSCIIELLGMPPQKLLGE